MTRLKQSARRKTSRYPLRSSLRNWSIGAEFDMGRPNDDVRSSVREEELEKIRVLAGLPPTVQLIAPSVEDRPELCPDGQIVMYEYPFLIGYRFPFTDLIKSLLTTYDLSPG